MAPQNPLLHVIFSSNTEPARPLIAEPMTSLTNVILALQTFLYASLLRKGPARTQKSAVLWAWTLAAVGVAGLAGALTHALYHDSAVRWVSVVRRIAWKAVGLSTAAASGLMLAASIFSAVPPGRRAPYLIGAAVKAAIFATASWMTGNFLFTILDYATSMLIVLYVQIRNWRTSAAAAWVTVGILVSFIAAAIQRSQISLHTHFNYNDLYHAVQMGAFHLLYEGARRERDCSGEEHE